MIRDSVRELDSLKSRLSRGLSQPRPWTLPLRRQQQAESWASSVGIEGFEIEPERAALLTETRSEPTAGSDNEAAFVCYSQAMEHVTVLARDPRFRWLDRVVLDLHFEACRFQRDRRPGLLRTGPISVTGPDGSVAYRAPDHRWLPELIDEFVNSLDEGSGPVEVKAAIAHLNLVSIHPFEDGNGRISRIIQSLVLARERILAPEFGSIEPHLAAHTDEYYAALGTVQAGTFDPSRDATPWVEFCLGAHISLARSRIDLVKRAAERWERLEELAIGRGWNERLVIALEQALFGSTDRSGYAVEAGVSPATASSDLRRLVDAGLLKATGAGPSVTYRPTLILTEAVTDHTDD